jgi:peptidoglycan/LPS O-acetylase OafA/YrhL
LRRRRRRREREANVPSHGGGYFQQTLLAVAFASLIARAASGRTGILARLLENPRLVKIGHMSYGIYLFHNLAPMIAGKIMPFLWNGWFESGVPSLLRMAVFAMITWGMALASWRWIESPMQNMRARMLGK